MEYKMKPASARRSAKLVAVARGAFDGELTMASFRALVEVFKLKWFALNQIQMSA
jgi:hypothetical protein